MLINICKLYCFFKLFAVQYLRCCKENEKLLYLPWNMGIYPECKIFLFGVCNNKQLSIENKQQASSTLGTSLERTDIISKNP